jgi:hypothetical protein
MPVEPKAGLKAAIGRGWLVLHETGTYVKFKLAPRCSPDLGWKRTNLVPVSRMDGEN